MSTYKDWKQKNKNKIILWPYPREWERKSFNELLEDYLKNEH